MTTGVLVAPATVLPGTVCPDCELVIVPLDPDEPPGLDVPLLLPPALPLEPGLLLPDEDEPDLVVPETVVPGTVEPPVLEPLEPDADPPGDEVPGDELPPCALAVPSVPVPLLPACPLDDALGVFFVFRVFASEMRGVIAANTAASVAPPTSSSRRRVTRLAIGSAPRIGIFCPFPTTIVTTQRMLKVRRYHTRRCVRTLRPLRDPVPEGLYSDSTGLSVPWRGAPPPLRPHSSV
jgi:hypothetical protein